MPRQEELKKLGNTKALDDRIKDVGWWQNYQRQLANEALAKLNAELEEKERIAREQKSKADDAAFDGAPEYDQL